MNKFFFSLLIVSVLLLSACGGQADSPKPVDASNTTPTAVSWEEAVQILNSGEVTGVFQTHSLDVTLDLKDGSHVKTVEPQIDAIFTAVEDCGAPCSEIIIATE